MAKWHYYNESGEKIGPVRGRDIKRLAQEGTVTPETRVEDENGRTALAKHVTGLTFPEAIQSEATPSESNPFTAALPDTSNPFTEDPSTIVVPLPSHQPVSVPPLAPKQVFCTNCGNPVSEQAVACMACGAKPIGYKKFCRQCGVALNPEQVVCVQCGAGLTSKFSGIGETIKDLTSAFETTEDSGNSFDTANLVFSTIKKIKNLPKPVIIAGVLFVALFSLLFLSNKVWQMETVPKLTVAEQAEVDKMIAEYGRDALLRYLQEVSRWWENRKTDRELVLKYVRYFVSQGADVNAKNRNGDTPLFLAIWEIEDAGLVNVLVSKGADVNAENDGRTLLMLAARGENVEIVKVLISKGADIRAKDSFGDTPLHYAARYSRNPEVAKFLVSKGADVNARHERGQTPLDAARAHGNMTVAEYLSSIR